MHKIPKDIVDKIELRNRLNGEIREWMLVVLILLIITQETNREQKSVRNGVIRLA